MIRLTIALLTWCLCSAPPLAAKPVIDVAQPLVEIRSFFSGANILVFGAVACGQPDCDLIVVVKGPPVPVTVRLKERVAGIWVNGKSERFNTAPGYFALAATQPVQHILSESGRLRAGLRDTTLFKPNDPNTADAAAFRSGLIDDLNQRGLYQPYTEAVSIKEGTLFRATLEAPAEVPTGAFEIKVFTVSDGDITSETQQTLTVKKAGFEAFVSDSAKKYPYFYGGISVFLALIFGFVSANIFSRP